MMDAAPDRAVDDEDDGDDGDDEDLWLWDEDRYSLRHEHAADTKENESSSNPNNSSSGNGRSTKRTYIARLILGLDKNLRSLGVDTDDDAVILRLEQMAVLIHESMCVSSRNYHSVQHVFDISQGADDPVVVLSALFHDCIYYHVDGGFSQRQWQKLHGTVTPNETGCRLSPDLGRDPLLQMVASVFGFQEGEQLHPMGGCNEFLSAVIACRELEPLLNRQRLCQIAACIEATIPFRPVDPATGQTPMERLHERLQKTNARFELGMTDSELVKAVQNAVVLSNSDVGNFATDDEGWFLDNTWNLLPESNAALRHSYLYTVQEFQFAISKMHGFFQFFLDPDSVFQQFRGVPGDDAFRALRERARRNVDVGRKYVAAKLLSVSVLSAFAELTGGDAPISLFMGDLPSRDRASVERRIESSLPQFNIKQLKDCNIRVYTLLSRGRKSESAFDVKQSPLAAFLYAYLGDAGLSCVLKEVQTYPMDKPAAYNLLAHLPRSAILVVADNIAKIAKSRSDKIYQVVASLPRRPTQEEADSKYFL